MDFSGMKIDILCRDNYEGYLATLKNDAGKIFKETVWILPLQKLDGKLSELTSSARVVYIRDKWYAYDNQHILHAIPSGKIKTFKLFFDGREMKFVKEICYNSVDFILEFLGAISLNNWLMPESQNAIFTNLRKVNSNSKMPSLFNNKIDVITAIIQTVGSELGSRFSVEYGDDIDLNINIKPTPRYISKIDKLEGPITFFNGFRVSIKCLNELINRKVLAKCKYCGKYLFSKEMIGDCCRRCYADKITYCEECGKEMTIYGGCQGLCRTCFEKYNKFKVNSYNYNPIMKYYNDDGTITNDGQSFSGIGIELEVDGAGENLKASKYIQELLNNEVYVKHDGSLNRGFEIITYPHTINSFYKIDWETALLDMIKHGYRSHDVETCGLHMHVSRNMLTKDNLAKLIYFFETHKEDLTKFSRRDSEHLNRWACFYTDKDDCRGTNIFEGCEVTKDLCYEILKKYDNKFNHDFRYKAINLQKKPTIEFRLMRGTLNSKTFLATIDFLLGLIRNSKTVSWKNINKTKLWLRGMKDNTVAYMKKRKCFGFDSNTDEKECDL